MPGPGWLRRKRARTPAAARPRRDWVAWVGVITALIAALGALAFNAISVMSTNQQIDVSRQGQLTDRYTAAVGQLGSDSVDVRLGGIYALERLMKDSPADQPTIVEVLAAFVRDNAGKRVAAIPTPTATPDLVSIAAQRPADILAALTVLGRRDRRHDAPGKRVDLSLTNLAGLDLNQVSLVNANLAAANLRGTRLAAADLTGAELFGADLSDAYLDSAHLDCASLQYANLTRADLSYAHMTATGLEGADLTGANLSSTDLTDSFHDDKTKLIGTTGTPLPSPTATAHIHCQP